MTLEVSLPINSELVLCLLDLRSIGGDVFGMISLRSVAISRTSSLKFIICSSSRSVRRLLLLFVVKRTEGCPPVQVSFLQVSRRG